MSVTDVNGWFCCFVLSLSSNLWSFYACQILSYISHLLEMLLIIFYMIIIGLKLFAKKILNYFKDLSYTVKKEVFWAKL